MEKSKGNFETGRFGCSVADLAMIISQIALTLVPSGSYILQKFQ